eukprot:461179-Pyramimonas_sp.AAC.1
MCGLCLLFAGAVPSPALAKWARRARRAGEIEGCSLAGLLSCRACLARFTDWLRARLVFVCLVGAAPGQRARQQRGQRGGGLLGGERALWRSALQNGARARRSGVGG